MFFRVSGQGGRTYRSTCRKFRDTKARLAREREGEEENHLIDVARWKQRAVHHTRNTVSTARRYRWGGSFLFPRIRLASSAHDMQMFVI